MDETSLPLLDSLRARKSEAWQTLIDGYTPLVQGEVFRYLQNPDDVDEVTQEVFQSAHRQIDTFERRRTGSLRRWLRTIARNLTVSRLRSTGRRVSGASPVQELLAHVEEPTDALDEAEQEEHIRYWRERIDVAARSHHSERDFAVFVAVKRDGEPVPQVAARMKIAGAQVYVICSRVTRTLQQIAKQWTELMGM